VNVINGAELLTETGSLRFVVGLNALAAGYDANGNMTLRLKDGARYFLAYDAESRLTSVSGTVSASFVYNGDGQRVTATIGTAAITTYIGGYFEWQGGVGKSYYFAGAQRIAMRTGAGLEFLLGDHLGSTSVTALASGAFDTETRYYPWGGVRWASGASPTDYLFTGQQEIATIGLYFYNSRFYDAALGRFISPDSIIPNPGDPVSFDRFAYVRNNPLKYIDPSGHETCDSDGYCGDYGNDELMRVSKAYGITFIGEWSIEYKWDVLIAVSLVGTRLGEEANMSGIEAFRAVYDLNDSKTFLFEWDPNCWGCREYPEECDAGTITGDGCISAWGYTNNYDHIEFASMSRISGLRRVNNVIHELGHAFNIRLGRVPEDALEVQNNLVTRPEGFYGIPRQFVWVQSSIISESEIFADQFIGWVYGLWGSDEYGPLRADFMTSMDGSDGWVDQAVQLP
jgi:RHS repeat-associated protein